MIDGAIFVQFKHYWFISIT